MSGEPSLIRFRLGGNQASPNRLQPGFRRRTEMDTSYNDRNRVQTQRLKDLRRLGEVDLRRPVGDHWTIAVALAHIEYWDGRAVGGLEAWRRHGLQLTLWTNDEAVVNDIRLRFWRELSPTEVLEQAIKTAEVLDRIVAELGPGEAEVVAAQRYRVLDRSLHRSQHLDEVDRALGPLLRSAEGDRVKIRDAKTDDLDALITLNREVQDIHVSLFPDLFHHTDEAALREWFGQRMQDRSTAVLVATDDPRVVGYMIMRFSSREAHVFCRARKCAYVDQACVAAEHRKRGVGRALIDEAKGRARAEGMTRLELDVWSRNAEAKTAFEIFGFTTYNEKMSMDI
jgi:ribosomal protein S18 acetylase RimI-like enzyme